MNGVSFEQRSGKNKSGIWRKFSRQKQQNPGPAARGKGEEDEERGMTQWGMGEGIGSGGRDCPWLIPVAEVFRWKRDRV